jgi:hypothetical protein
MPFLVTSNVVALILLAILSITGSFSAFRFFGRTYKTNRKFVILEVDSSKTKEINRVLSGVSPPFTLEVAVSQLGKQESVYIGLPANKAKKIKQSLDAKFIRDYHPYYPGGFVVGGYAKSEDSIENVSLDSIDFSEVNEIGEGAVVQFLVSKKSRGNLLANVRVLVSAPSSYQAKEILGDIKKSLEHIKFTETKSDEFVERFNGRVFNEKELVKLSL